MKSLLKLTMLVSFVAVFSPAMAAEQSASAPSSAAPAASAPAPREPLLIIRFNQKRVNYDRALDEAVHKAQQAKQNVRFDVVSFQPALQGNAAQQERQAVQYREHLQEVASAIVGKGVINKSVMTHVEDSSAVASQEVHIFVR